MTSLTQIAITTRRIIRYSLYVIILLIIARMLFGLGRSLFLALFPPPPPAPTVTFGPLPKLTFPDRPGLPTLSFTLETIEGSLPTLPTQAKVFFMPKPVRTQLNLDLARQKATSLGFSPEGEELSDTLYKFPHPQVPATLKLNIVTSVFSIDYDLAADPAVLERRPPPPEVASSQARSFLSSGRTLPADLTGPITHEFLKVQGGALVPALSLSEANFTKVNFFRKSFDELPSLTPTPAEGNVWFLVSGETTRGKQVISGQFHHFPVDESQSATYPIKTASAAFEELKQGSGFVGSLGTNSDGKITVRRVYLAYYDSGLPDQYYQPIIVFEGDRNFMAYVPAVTAEYYGK